MHSSPNSKTPQQVTKHTVVLKDCKIRGCAPGGADFKGTPKLPNPTTANRAAAHPHPSEQLARSCMDSKSSRKERWFTETWSSELIGGLCEYDIEYSILNVVKQKKKDFLDLTSSVNFYYRVAVGGLPALVYHPMHTADAPRPVLKLPWN